MTEPSVRSGRRLLAPKDDESVTPLELFFDLVFVYALTQVTAVVASHLTATGLVQAAIILALVWWSWVGYSWLGAVVHADEGVARTAFIMVMAAVFVLALAIPEAFDDQPGGLSAPLVLALSYAVIRYVHLFVFGYTARSTADRGLRSTLIRFGGIATVAVALLVIGATLDPTARMWIWASAVVIDYVGTQMLGASGWRLPSPHHFAERHGLIIIIGLGESIVAIGVGASDLPLAAPLVVAAAIGVWLAATLWWVYFDVTAIGARDRLASASGAEQTAMARDAFSFLHLPMMAGIVLTALGLKKAIEYIGGAAGHTWHDSVHGIAQWALHLGPALFVAALVATRIRIIRRFSWSRAVATVALVATAPIGAHIPVLWDLVLVTALMVALIVFERIVYRDVRRRIRAHAHGH